MKQKNEWFVPAAFLMALVIIIASILAMVDLTDERHNVIPAETVSMNGQTYDVLDLLTDSGMDRTSTELSRFSSLAELNDIVGQEPNDYVYHYWGDERIDAPLNGGMELAVDADSGAGLAGASADSGMSYSDTNTQVAGVDEGDIVKNDGRYAYIASANRKSLFIIDAYPPENAAIVSEIQVNGTIKEVYTSQDILVIIQQTYYFEGGFRDSDYMRSDRPTVFVDVYDLKDRIEPALLRDASLIGYYSTSRLIDDNLYLIASQYNYGQYENESELPMPIDCLYYIEDSNAQYSLTSFLTLDITDAESNPGVMGIYMSGASNIYVSHNNIYITHMKPRNYSGIDWNRNDYQETTVIHRIQIQGNELKYRARGEVPGRVLNRYSMDEHNGHFRIATTKGWSWGAGPEQSRNIVTVLDMALNEAGKLDDIAPGERIYSARFMGNRCYLVTFRQTDPFFVIDLHDAENPEILGELKIPGYSSYLHPYDENHIIGLGKDGGSVKISLFNVTDVANPTELANYQVQGDYSNSPALYDPHAFNFDAGKGLLVIPVHVNSYSHYDYAPGSQNGDSGSKAMVFSIDPENGINKLASIQHPDNSPPVQNYWGQYYYDYRSSEILRSFFMGDTLYTVSDSYLKANNLENYGQEALVELG